MGKKVCLGRCPGEAWINADECGTIFHCLGYPPKGNVMVLSSIVPAIIAPRLWRGAISLIY